MVKYSSVTPNGGHPVYSDASRPAARSVLVFDTPEGEGAEVARCPGPRTVRRTTPKIPIVIDGREVRRVAAARLLPEEEALNGKRLRLRHATWNRSDGLTCPLVAADSL